MGEIKEHRWASSDDCENWTCESLGELIDWMECDEPVEVGRTVYVGEVRRLDKLRFLPDAQHIIEIIGEHAYDNGGGEHAEDYPDISKAGVDSLNHALRQWAAAHLPEPNFYMIENVKPYTITEADIATSSQETASE